MATLLTIVLMGGLPVSTPAAEPKDESYKPKFSFCNTRACDERVRAIRHRRKVQARHKAQVRAEAHDAHRLRMVRPHRAWLASTRRCESGGRYHIATGNGFYGAYQFTLSSWRAVGGRGMPHQNEPLEQDYRAVKLLYLQGRGAWPVCG